MCERTPANALYSDCSPQSESIYCQANGHAWESKQTHCLIRVGSPCVYLLKAIWFMKLFSFIVEKPEDVSAEV